MAVPSAVMRQRVALQASLGLDENGNPLPTPVTPSQVVETTPEIVATPANTSAAPATPVTPTAPPVVSTPTDLTAATSRIQELEHLLRTRDGQTSTAMRQANEANTRAEATAAQVKALEDAVAELTKQKQTAENLGTARQLDSEIPSLEDVPELTPAQREAFGDDSVEFVKNLTKKELLAYIKPLLGKVKAMEQSLSRLSDLDRLPNLERTVQASAAETQRVREEEFFRKEVLSFFPDFESVREVPDWKDYLSTDIPGKGIKIGNLLNQYRMQHDAPGIRSIIETYYAKNKARPNIGDLAVPNKTQTNGEPPTKPKFRASEYKSKLRDFTSRRLPKADWDAYKLEFNTALNEGRVEMDERL